MTSAGIRNSHRARLTWVIGGVLALNLVAWATYLHGALTSQGPVVGAGIVAFVLGARHAFDADHIAVIDDCTRLAVRHGQRRVGMGFTFALGHSSVVLLLTLGVLWLASEADSMAATWQATGSPFVQGFAALFLLFVGMLNLRVLIGLMEAQRSLRAGAVDGAAQVERALAKRGVFSRLLGTRAQSSVISSWRLFPVGFLFGLGLETASEVALLAVAASSAASGSASLSALLALPLLFAAGMSLFDTGNSLLVSRLYWTTGQTDARRLTFNVSMTAVTAAVGVGVGLIYLAGLLVDVAGLSWLSGIASVSEHFELLGFVLVSAYLVVWLVALLPRRLRSATGVPMTPATPAALAAPGVLAAPAVLAAPGVPAAPGVLAAPAVLAVPGVLAAPADLSTPSQGAVTTGGAVSSPAAQGPDTHP
jgi:high-affinity nickel-transport protein